MYEASNSIVDDKNIHFVIMRFKGKWMWVQCVYGYDFHEMHARMRGSKSLLLFTKL